MSADYTEDIEDLFFALETNVDGDDYPVFPYYVAGTLRKCSPLDTEKPDRLVQRQLSVRYCLWCR